MTQPWHVTTNKYVNKMLMRLVLEVDEPGCQATEKSNPEKPQMWSIVSELGFLKVIARQQGSWYVHANDFEIA